MIAGPDLKPHNVAPHIKKMLGENVCNVIVLDLHNNLSKKLIKIIRKLAKIIFTMSCRFST